MEECRERVSSVIWVGVDRCARFAANSGRRRDTVVLGGTDNARGKRGLELELGGEGFRLRIALG